MKFNDFFGCLKYNDKCFGTENQFPIFSPKTISENKILSAKRMQNKKPQFIKIALEFY